MVPLLGNTDASSERAACASNLRQIGRALHTWGLDYSGSLPWRVSIFEGGTQISPKPGAVWYEFAWLSNQLVTPRFLACPSDPDRRRASNFSRNEGGLLNQLYRDNAVSYIIGLDAGYVSGTQNQMEDSPDHVVSGDRNLQVDVAGGVACSTGINNAAAVLPTNGRTAWTNGIHGVTGNVLLHDGQVRQLSNDNIKNVLSIADDNGSLHFLIP